MRTLIPKMLINPISKYFSSKDELAHFLAFVDLETSTLKDLNNNHPTVAPAKIKKKKKSDEEEVANVVFAQSYSGRGVFKNLFNSENVYREYELLTGLELTNNPNLLANPQNALLVAAVYWQNNNIKSFIPNFELICSNLQLKKIVLNEFSNCYQYYLNYLEV